MGTPLGLSCYFYQGGPGFHTKALAYYGVPADDYLYGAPYPLGDITGDGIDDFALIASYYQSTITRYWAAIWLFNGDRKLNPTNAVDQTKDTDEFRLSIFPNPVQRGGMVSIQGFESSSGKHALTISDALGREVKREDRFLSEEGAFQFQLDVQRIPSGVYYLTVRSPSKRTVKSLTIVDKR